MYFDIVHSLQVIKCQPKAKFSRTKSGSEMGDDERRIRDDSDKQTLLPITHYRVVSPSLSGAGPEEEHFYELQTRVNRERSAPAAHPTQ